MIDDKKQAELDQVRAALVEHYPVFWRQMYLKLIEEGFTEERSFEILKTYITASCAACPPG